MADVTGEDLSGSRFTDLRLCDARFRDVDLSGAQFRWVDLTGVVISGAELVDVDISGELQNVRVNGVDIGPLVDDELNRRYPERAKMHPTGPAGFAEAWTIIERLWAGTVDRARALPPALLHECVGEEWSFIQTLRHLVFATDAWVLRAILGDASPWDPLDLPFDEMAPIPGIPWDKEVRPSLDEVLTLRRERMATVRRVIDGLTEISLAGMTEPVGEPGYPRSQSFPVRECLLIVLNEEWQHRLYAERDLAVLGDRLA